MVPSFGRSLNSLESKRTSYNIVSPVHTALCYSMLCPYWPKYVLQVGALYSENRVYSSSGSPPGPAHTTPMLANTAYYLSAQSQCYWEKGKYTLHSQNHGPFPNLLAIFLKPLHNQKCYSLFRLLLVNALRHKKKRHSSRTSQQKNRSVAPPIWG